MNAAKRFFELTKKIKEKKNKIALSLKSDDYITLESHKKQLISMEEELENLRDEVDLNSFYFVELLEKLLNGQQRTDREREFLPLAYKFRENDMGQIEVNLGSVDILFVFDNDGRFKGIINKLKNREE